MIRLKHKIEVIEMVDMIAMPLLIGQLLLYRTLDYSTRVVIDNYHNNTSVEMNLEEYMSEKTESETETGFVVDSEGNYIEDNNYWMNKLKINEYNFLPIKLYLGDEVYFESLRVISDEVGNVENMRAYGYCSNYIENQDGLYHFYLIIENSGIYELICSEEGVQGIVERSDLTEYDLTDMYAEQNYSNESGKVNYRDDFQDIKTIYGFMSTSACEYVIDYLTEHGILEKSFYMGLIEEPISEGEVASKVAKFFIGTDNGDVYIGNYEYTSGDVALYTSSYTISEAQKRILKGEY